MTTTSAGAPCTRPEDTKVPKEVDVAHAAETGSG